MPSGSDLVSQVYGGQGGAAAPVLAQVVPTVFVALGGSGQRVLMRLRKRFHERDLNAPPPYARFLFVDTDAQAFVPDREAPEDYADIQPRPGEQIACTINETQFHRVFDGLESGVDSAHMAWLKPGLRGLGPQTLVHGAGTFRQFGRLAFFLYYSQIRERLERQIREVLRHAAERPADVDPSRIEVVIVTSLAGGTGSGMFLDVAYLVRDILEAPDFERLASKYVTIVAFMPTLWEEDQPDLYPKLQRNAYAALLELEYYGTPRTGDELFLGDAAERPARPLDFKSPYGSDPSRTGFHVTWNGQDRYLRGPAWGSCFLIDNVNDLAPNAPLPRDEIFQMVADYLFLDFEQHGFAIRKRSARSNLVQYKDRWHATWVRRPGGGVEYKQTALVDTDVVYATQNGCGFSTFGLSEIYFDLEKLYQAAGYRLAWHMIKHRWIGVPRQYTDEDLKNWVKADLAEGRRKPGQPEPPSFHPEALIRRLLTGPSGCLLDELEADLAALDGTDPSEGLAALQTVRKRHEAVLAPDGQARVTVNQNLTVLRGSPQSLGPLRERLRWLALDHVTEHGVAATLRLLAQYQKKLVEVGEALSRRRAPEFDADAVSRLAEAGQVGSFVRRRTQQIEYPYALDAVKTYFRQKYARLAAGLAEREADAPARGGPVGLMTGTSRYVGSADQRPGPELTAFRGTLHDLCTRASGFLDRIAQQLDDRFRRSRQEDEPGIKRKRSLSTGWDEHRYDEKINEALILDVEVGPGGGGPNPLTFDWERFEARVVDRLRAEPGAPAAQTRAEFLLHWLEHETNPGDVNRVAERLARVCRSVLRGDGPRGGLDLTDVEHGNAVDLLMSKQPAERQDQIDRMVITSYPYLPTLGHQTIESLRPAFTNLYGHKPNADHPRNTPKAANADAIAAVVSSSAANHTPGPGGQTSEPLMAEDSSLLLAREMAGFPLQYYSRLNQLQAAYLNAQSYTRSNDECHIDYHESWRDLPDVRPVGNATYTRIRENIDHVLYALMIGVIVWEEGEFRVKVPNRLGGAPDTYSLGIHIHRLIKFACEDDAIRGHLVLRWTDWSGRASTRQWACLLASCLKTYYAVKNKVISLDRGNQQAPPVRNCFESLAERTRQRLDQEPDGPAWTAHLLGAWDGRSNTVGAPTFLEQVSQRCLRQIRPDLPIFQILEGKAASIDLPGGPDPTPQ
ncbi:MAG: tubulin-like doman-containing protein [Isosphaeraceae bacterium]